MVIFPSFYFGPVSYYIELVKHNSFALEVCENYQKQTYRNRMYILGPNGKQRLGIPIKHGGSRNIQEIHIDYEQNWCKEHIKSIEAAYRRSPYYEFYEDDLNAIYNQRFSRLLDLNKATLKFMDKQLDLDLEWDETQAYVPEIPSDFRTKFSAKKESAWNLPAYNQVFQEKLPFHADLCILDLLFNLGPETAHYIKKIE